MSIGWATWKLFAIVTKTESDEVEIGRVDNPNKSRRPFENILLGRGSYKGAEDDCKRVIITMDSGILTGLKGK